MRLAILGVLLAASIPATASATVTILSSVGYDFAPAAGADKTITFDAGGAAFTSTGPGFVETGTVRLQWAAPATSDTTLEPSAYFVGQPGKTIATEASIGGFGTYTGLSLYWGSIDGFNTLDLFNGATLVGSVKGTDISPTAGGDRYGADTNRRVTLSTDIGFDRIGLRTGSNAFEVDNLSLIGPAAAVPEPGTWATLLAGLATVGLVARRRRAAVAL